MYGSWATFHPLSTNERNVQYLEVLENCVGSARYSCSQSVRSNQVIARSGATKQSVGPAGCRSYHFKEIASGCALAMTIIQSFRPAEPTLHSRIPIAAVLGIPINQLPKQLKGTSFLKLAWFLITCTISMTGWVVRLHPKASAFRAHIRQNTPGI